MTALLTKQLFQQRSSSLYTIDLLDYDPLQQTAFILFSRRNPIELKHKNPYQISWLWSTENHLAPTKSNTEPAVLSGIRVKQEAGKKVGTGKRW